MHSSNRYLLAQDENTPSDRPLRPLLARPWGPISTCNVLSPADTAGLLSHGAGRRFLPAPHPLLSGVPSGHGTPLNYVSVELVIATL